jgi:hypothetical protein
LPEAFRGSGGERSRSNNAALQRFLLELRRPDPRDVFTRQVDNGIKAVQLPGIEGLPRIPLHFAFAGRPPYQRRSLMTVASQAPR